MPRRARPSTTPPEPEAHVSGAERRWLAATYRPVSLFSLRITHATSKGGKSLVLPTPYAVKMALLDASFRRHGPETALPRARELFDLIKWRKVRVLPPEHCVVQNTFVKVLDHSRESGEGPFRRTIAYREFAFFQGDMTIALPSADFTEAQQASVTELFAHINYFGKRGSFWQFLGAKTLEGDLSIGFTVALTDGSLPGVSAYGMIRQLDDFGEKLCTASDGFDRVSTYGSGSIKLGEHRVLVPTAIPYRLRSASRNFTWYERMSPPNHRSITQGT
jgi:hypothetical protein